MKNFVKETVVSEITPTVVFDPNNNKGDDGIPRLEIEDNVVGGKTSILIGSPIYNRHIVFSAKSARAYAKFFAELADEKDKEVKPKDTNDFE